MTKLEAAIERLRALPQAVQDSVAAQIDLLLDQNAEDALTDEQWAEIEARLDADEGFTPHDEIASAFRQRFPE